MSTLCVFLDFTSMENLILETSAETNCAWLHVTYQMTTNRKKKSTAKSARQKYRPSYLDFDRESYPWRADIDYMEHPELYRVGKGEQGVLICQPYKSELVQHWRFKTPDEARRSARTIFAMFEAYLRSGDFVGADMARKYLQMGFTRARRYANYKGGRKYDKENDYAQNDRGTGDPEKAESAEIFFRFWKMAEANYAYAEMKEEWKRRFG